eukprot:scaffold131894_cov45-Phaeocystis_antarctica.AAC.1
MLRWRRPTAQAAQLVKRPSTTLDPGLHAGLATAEAYIHCTCAHIHCTGALHALCAPGGGGGWVKLEDLPSLFDRFTLCRLPPPAAAASDAAGRPATPKSKAQSCGCDSCAAGAGAGAGGGARDLSTRASLPARPGAVHEHCCWLDAPRGGPPHHPLWPQPATAPETHPPAQGTACSGRPSRPERSALAAWVPKRGCGCGALVPRVSDPTAYDRPPRSNPQLEVRCAHDAHLTVCFAQRHGARVRTRARALTLSAMRAERSGGGGSVGVGGGGVGAGAAVAAATAQRAWRSDDAAGLLGRVGPLVARE